MNEENLQGSCIKCNLYYPDKSKNKHSELCTQCRKEQLKYPISKVVILFLMVVGVLCGIAYKQFPQIQKDYALYVNSRTVKDGDVTKSLTDLKQVTKNHKNFIDAKACMVEIAMQSGRYDEAVDIINSSLIRKKLDRTKYGNLFYYNDKLNKYANTYQKCNQILKIANNFSTHEESMHYAKTNLEKLFDDYSCSDAITYYYLAFISDDLGEKENYINKSLEKDGNFMDSKIYLCQVEIYTNRLSEAKEIIKEIIKKDNEVPMSYSCLAVIDMLENNYDKALENAEKAYSLSKSYTYSVNESLMVALYKNNKNERLEKIKKETLDNEKELDEDLNSLLDGKKTIQEFYSVNVEEK